MTLPQIQSVYQKEFVQFPPKEKTEERSENLKMTNGAIFTLAISSWLIVLYFMASLFGAI